MKVLINVFKSLITKERKPIQLGRWSLNHCEKKVSRKTDMTNEDHCGTCSTMRLNYLTQENKSLVNKIQL